MDKLHENVNSYLHSGSKPCKSAAAGEYLIGISFAYPGVVMLNQGAPVQIVLPSEGIGWDMDGDRDHEGDAAPGSSEGGGGLLGERRSECPVQRVLPGAGTQGRHRHGAGKLSANEGDMLIKQDFYWSRRTAKPSLQEWQKRYGSKDARRADILTLR